MMKLIGSCMKFSIEKLPDAENCMLIRSFISTLTEYKPKNRTDFHELPKVIRAILPTILTF